MAKKYLKGAHASRGKPSAHSSLGLQTDDFLKTRFVMKSSSEFPGNFSVLHLNFSAAACFDLAIDPEHVPI